MNRADVNMSKATVKTLLIEDHGLIRAGLRVLIEGIEGVTIVGEGGDGRAALQLVQECQPDVVIMDVAMPNLNGIEAAEQIAKHAPGVSILILSMHASEDYVIRALRAGASGYILKDAAMSELEFAIRAVARGEIYLSSAVSKDVVSKLLDGGKEGGDLEPARMLTARQREVLQLIAEGKNTKEIAYLLGTSIKTVESHRANIMERLQIFEVVGLTRFAIRNGIAQLDDSGGVPRGSKLR